MYSKKHILLTVVITFVLTSFCASLGYKFYSNANEDVLVRAKRIISDQYVDKLTEEQIEKMDDMALSAMIASLDDPYSYYFDVETGLYWVQTRYYNPDWCRWSRYQRTLERYKKTTGRSFETLKELLEYLDSLF